MSVKCECECCSVWKCTITHLLDVNPSNPLPQPFHFSLFKFEDLVAEHILRFTVTLRYTFTNGFIGYKGHILWFPKTVDTSVSVTSTMNIILSDALWFWATCMNQCVHAGTGYRCVCKSRIYHLQHTGHAYWLCYIIRKANYKCIILCIDNPADSLGNQD